MPNSFTYYTTYTYIGENGNDDVALKFIETIVPPQEVGI